MHEGYKEAFRAWRERKKEDGRQEDRAGDRPEGREASMEDVGRKGGKGNKEGAKR